MSTLAPLITYRLSLRTRCTIFEDELDRYWPDKATRIDRIQAFASKNGWTVKIDEARRRATFMQEQNRTPEAVEKIDERSTRQPGTPSVAIPIV